MGKREKTAGGEGGCVFTHAFSLWQVLRHPADNRRKGRVVALCAWGMLCSKTPGSAGRQKGAQGWIPSQGPWWELPEVCNMSCRRGERFSSHFFLLQHPKGLCRSLEIPLLLSWLPLGKQGLYFPATL